MLIMFRLGMRLAEVCSLCRSSIKWSHGRWIVKCKVKGGREEKWPLPKDVKEAIDTYLARAGRCRDLVHSDGPDAPLFQPIMNHRTLVYDKAFLANLKENLWCMAIKKGSQLRYDVWRCRNAAIG